MELTFTVRRVLLFLACLLVFALLGNFSNPADLNAEYYNPRITKSWFYCIALFVTGAGSVSVVDHVVGLMDRTNIRFLYILLGILLMGSAFVWMHVLKSAAENS